MNSDIDAKLAEINDICSDWEVEARPPIPKATPTRSYASRAPAALNCLNRFAKNCDFDQQRRIYEQKFRAMLIFARLGWAKPCRNGGGYKAGIYKFNLPASIPCDVDGPCHRNLCRDKIDDVEEAHRIIEAFLREFPLTEEEQESLEGYYREQEAFDWRCYFRWARETYGEDWQDEEDDDPCWDGDGY